MQYRNDIQGLRAIAILLVIAAHFGIPGFAWGFIGVDIFFVISGYLITGLIYTEIKSEGKFNFLLFYARRILRLLPNLFFMIGVVLALGLFLLTPNEQIFNSKVAIYSSLWLSNFYFALSSVNYFDNSQSTSPFLHTWSLGVEEQFYLLWPAIILFIFALGKTKRIIGSPLKNLFIFGVPIASLIYCINLTSAHPTWAYYMMPSRLWQFCAGGAGYLIVSLKLYNRFRITNKIFPFGPFLGLGLLTLSAVYISPNQQYPGYLALLPTAATALLLMGHTQPSYFYQFLGSYIFRKLGDISYSAYLWHWPSWVISGLFFFDEKIKHLMIAIFATAVISALSFAFIETPIRKSSTLKSKPRTVLLGAVLATMLAFSASHFLYKTAQQKIQSPQILKYEKIRANKPDIYAFACDQWYMSAEVRPCVIGKESAKHTVVLFGDSIGAQWFPAIFNIYNVPDWKIYVLTKSSCPIVDEKIFYTRIGREYTECETWRNGAIDLISALHPDVIFIGSSLPPFEKNQWQAGTSRILKKVSDKSEQIFIFRSTPELPYNAIDCLIRKEIISGFFGSNSLCEPYSEAHYNSQVFSWIQIAAKEFQNVKTLDLNNYICPNNKCMLEKDGQVIFRDEKHLTVDFVNSATNELINVMTTQN